MPNDDLISAYDYSLPQELIAQVPAARRDASRLMVVDRRSGTIEHRSFGDLPDLLAPHDLLVLNNTRVVPARLIGFRSSSGGKWEGLFLREEAEGTWRLIGHTRGKLRAGERLTLVPAGSAADQAPGKEQDPAGPRGGPSKATSPDHLELQLLERSAGGAWLCRPLSDEPTLALLERFGTMPLPPYLHRPADAGDRERYQTTFAERPGAVAAPTAGLHFTPGILQRCHLLGIATAKVTLHVGLGTFRPVSVERLEDHQMHQEWCELPSETVSAIADAQAHGGRVVAVGTTAVRTLESVRRLGPLRPWQGETDLFIRPPYRFQIVDALVTNFHLPKSTLLVLVSTFAGRELMLEAYAEAIRQRYRFYSYGDAMLIV